MQTRTKEENEMKKPKKHRRPNPLKERGPRTAESILTVIGEPIEALMTEAVAMLPIREALRREKATPTEMLMLSAAIPIMLRTLRISTRNQQLPTDQLLKGETIQ
jgi:hypothetical protein